MKILQNKVKIEYEKKISNEKEKFTEILNECNTTIKTLKSEIKELKKDKKNKTKNIKNLHENNKLKDEVIDKTEEENKSLKIEIEKLSEWISNSTSYILKLLFI